ncbi:hypothetical protein KY342_05550 [Candidatus Woesearchaeota archaeon]|nr:hypothetical protein [Candidatus Woesearchaeota archaeon]
MDDYDLKGPGGQYFGKDITDEEKADADDVLYKAMIELGVGPIQEALRRMEQENPSESLTCRIKDPYFNL